MAKGYENHEDIKAYILKKEKLFGFTRDKLADFIGIKRETLYYKLTDSNRAKFHDSDLVNLKENLKNHCLKLIQKL